VEKDLSGLSSVRPLLPLHVNYSMVIDVRTDRCVCTNEKRESHGSHPKAGLKVRQAQRDILAGGWSLAPAGFWQSILLHEILYNASVVAVVCMMCQSAYLNEGMSGRRGDCPVRHPVHQAFDNTGQN